MAQLIGRLMIALLSIDRGTPEFTPQTLESEDHHKGENRSHENHGEKVLEIPGDDYVIHTKPVWKRKALQLLKKF